MLCCSAFENRARSTISWRTITSEFENLIKTKVVDPFNTFPESIHSLILVEYSGSYDFCKFAVRFCEFQNSVNVFSLGGRLRLLRGRICLRLYIRCCSMFLDLSIECSYAFVRWVELELYPSEYRCPDSIVLFSDQFVQYMFKVVLRDLTCLIWVLFWSERCRYFQYLSMKYLFANFGWIVLEIWICKDCCQFSLSE
jgi:hypothetical protein